MQPPAFAETPLALTSAAADLDIADLDGDGIPDVELVVGGWSAYEVHLGLGGGTFGPGHVSPMPSDTWATSLADVTGDGSADRLRITPTTLFSEKNTGGGAFTTVAGYGVIADANEVIAADLNDDGRPDAVISSGDTFSQDGVTTWLGKGDGTFGPGQKFPGYGGYAPWPLEAADLNGDGRVDLVTADALTVLRVIPGKGDGSFRTPQQIATGVAYCTALGDVNADGLPDIVSNDGFQLEAFLNLGTADFTFAPPILSGSASGNVGHHLLVADLNGDGWPDVAAIRYVTHELTISLGHGDGSFDDPLPVPVTNGAYLVQSADLDGNGSTDLVVTSWSAGTCSVLLNMLPAWPWSPVGTGLSGAMGIPLLHGDGALLAGRQVTLTLTHALPHALASFVLGTSELAIPFKGGVMVPLPSLVWPQGIDGAGRSVLVATFPNGVPPLTTLYVQAWIQDTGPKGFAASNGVRGLVP